MRLFVDVSDWEETAHPRIKGGAGGGRFAKKGSATGSTKSDKPKSDTGGLKKYLDFIAEYSSQGKLLSEHGRPYTFDYKSFEGKRGKPQMCYMNAGRMALRNPDMTYVEGVVSVHGVPIEHAWCTDGNDNVVDPTLTSSKFIEGYYGIPFKTKYLAETTMRTRLWGLISHTNPKLFKEKPDVFMADGLPQQPISQQYLQDADTWQEGKHPRAKSGARGGQFVKKGTSTGVATKPTNSKSAEYGDWKPPEKSARWEGGPKQLWDKARKVAADLDNALTEDLQESLLHLRPGNMNKIDRPLRKAVLVELAKRLVTPPPKERKVAAKPTPQQPPTPPPPATTVSMEKAIVNKGVKEKAFHRRAFARADPFFAGVIQNTRYIGSVTFSTGHHGWYRSGNHSITMREETKDNPRAEDGLWRHEYGHAIDYNGNYKPMSAAFIDRLDNEGEAIVDRAKGLQSSMPFTEGSDALARVGLTYRDVRDFVEKEVKSAVPATETNEIIEVLRTGTISTTQFFPLPGPSKHYLMDFIGALTKNRIGYGHSNQYYDDGNGINNRCTEAFANYVALTQGPYKKIAKPILLALAPSTCSAFEQLLQARAEGVKP